MHGTLARPQDGTAPAPTGRIGFWGLALRLAFRDLRGGLRGFGVLIGCLALGVAAIATVTSAARSVGDGLNREGRRILGADAAFILVQREASEAERAFLAGRGQLSVMATMRAMADAGDKGAALVELKAVDAAYPTVGEVETEPKGPLPDFLALRDGRHGALVDPVLLARLDIQPGQIVRIGEAQIEIGARSPPSPTASPAASASARACS